MKKIIDIFVLCIDIIDFFIKKTKFYLLNQQIILIESNPFFIYHKNKLIILRIIQ
jgi:hypothetical protein